MQYHKKDSNTKTKIIGKKSEFSLILVLVLYIM